MFRHVSIPWPMANVILQKVSRHNPIDLATAIFRNAPNVHPKAPESFGPRVLTSVGHHVPQRTYRLWGHHGPPNCGFDPSPTNVKHHHDRSSITIPVSSSISPNFSAFKKQPGFSRAPGPDHQNSCISKALVHRDARRLQCLGGQLLILVADQVRGGRELVAGHLLLA